MVGNGNVLNSLSSLYQSLTKTEKKIADVITQSPDCIMQYSLAQLAERLDVGEATLVRFCRTLGFKGFSDFKLAFSIELAKTREGRDDTVLETEILPNDDSQTIAHKLQSAINSVMNETINLLDFHQLEVVVNAIRGANRVFLFGVGSSGVTAEEAKNKFMRIGMNCVAPRDNHTMRMVAVLLEPNDVVFAISHSGETAEILETVAIARARGIKVISLTEDHTSSLRAASDVSLTYIAEETPLETGSIASKTAQFFLVDLVYTEVLKILPPSAMEKKIRTTEAVRNAKRS